MKLRLFVSCAPGLEPLLAAEVAVITEARVTEGGVEAEGDRETLARILVETGLASHVLVRVASFPVRELAALEGHVGRLPWSGWLRAGTPRTFRVSAQRSRLYHTGAIEERVARAVGARLGDGLGPAEKEASDAVPLLVRMSDDRCTISLDASGAPLHRRGYRLDPHRAPLREDLARALLVAARYDGSGPLIDPMCGSGTLAIEAARIAAKIAPGLERTFAAERTPLDQGEIAAARTAARARVRPVSIAILARDRDPLAIEAARGNAARADVSNAITFEVGALSTAAASASALGVRAPLVATNPPWGGRLGDPGKLRPLYGALGAFVRGCGGSLALAAHDRKLAYATGMPLASAALTDLGGTKVSLMIPSSP